MTEGGEPATLPPFSPRNVLHAFRLTSPDEIDDEFAGWLAEAYAVGEQRHLGPDASRGR